MGTTKIGGIRVVMVLEAMLLVAMVVAYFAQTTPLAESQDRQGDTVGKEEQNIVLYVAGDNKTNTFDWSLKKISAREKNRLTITIVNNSTASHDFLVQGLSVTAKVPANRIVTVSFTPSSKGVFTYRCLSPCGPFHPFQSGLLTVA